MQKEHLLNRIRELSAPVQAEKIDHPVQLTSLHNVKCVAFDFYGTMFISAAGDIGVDQNRDKGKERYFKKALKACGFNILDHSVGPKGINLFQQTIKRHISNLKKQGIDYPEPDERKAFYEVLAALRQDGMINGKLPENIGALFTVEFEFRSNTIWPMPQLLDDLQKLKDRNLKLGLISNSQFYSPLVFEAITGTSMTDFGFIPDLQVWSYRHEIKKPSLPFYHLFIDKLPAYNLQPDEILYVGNDLGRDIIPAKKLGMQTALFVGDKRSLRHKKEDLTEQNSPDIIIDELSQVDECLA